jgi:hypothetical protein
MARLLLQTDDARTLLEERDIGLADLDDEAAGRRLLGRLGRAIESSPQRPSRKPIRHVLAFVPAGEHRALRR